LESPLSLGTKPRLAALVHQIDPCAAARDLTAGGSLKEALMTEWRDNMVERPETEDGAYAAGWTVSGLAVLGAIVALWVFGI
jgi:hypothetical protein